MFSEAIDSRAEASFSRDLLELDKIAFPKYHEKLKREEDEEVQEGQGTKEGALKSFDEKLVSNFRLERETYQTMLKHYRLGDVTYV